MATKIARKKESFVMNETLYFIERLNSKLNKRNDLIRNLNYSSRYLEWWIRGDLNP